jgi:hypothetical protein
MMASLKPVPHRIPATSIWPKPGLPSSPFHTRETCFTPTDTKSASLRERPPSEGIFTTQHLSPSVSRSSGTHRSSNCSSNTCESHDSLAPPQTNIDNDGWPYKARSERSESLTMLYGRSNLSPNGQTQNTKRQSRNQKCGTHRKHQAKKASHNQIILEEHQTNSYWWLPKSLRSWRASSSVDSPSKTDFNNSEGELDHEKRKWMAAPALPTTTRRWSSTTNEHQILPLNQSFDPVIAVSKVRSKTWATATDASEVADVVRARLTCRKVPFQHLETPASITLRRASTQSSLATKTSPFSNSGSKDFTPELNTEWWDRRSTSTYLITAKEIESITSLIEEFFRGDKNSKTYISPSNMDYFSNYGNGGDRPDVTSKGLIPPLNPPQRSLTLENIHCTPKVALKIPAANNKKCRKTSTMSKMCLHRSIHEIIWEGNGSQHSPCSSPQTPPREDEAFHTNQRSDLMLDGPNKVNNGYIPSSISIKSGDKLVGLCSLVSTAASSEVSTPIKSAKIPPQESSDSSLPYPNNLISQWSWDASNRDSAGDILQLETNISKPTTEQTYHKTPTTTNEDVISFPPLPTRKETTDWITPLPDINSSETCEDTSLWSRGIDAHTGGKTPQIPTALPNIYTPDKNIHEFPNKNKDKPLSLFKKPSQSETPNRNLNQSHSKRKSIILQHPFALHRTGETFKLGSAIGTSTGARRNSSTRAIQIRIEHKEVADRVDDRKPWTKPRRDSGWPTTKSSAGASTDRVDSVGTIGYMFSPTYVMEDGQNADMGIAPSPEKHLGLERARIPSSGGNPGFSKSRSMEFLSISAKRASLAVNRQVQVEERSPPLPNRGRVRSYSRVTGTGLTTAGRANAQGCGNGGGTGCEFDHWCGETPARSRNPSVDWIS